MPTFHWAKIDARQGQHNNGNVWMWIRGMWDIRTTKQSKPLVLGPQGQVYTLIIQILKHIKSSTPPIKINDQINIHMAMQISQNPALDSVILLSSHNRQMSINCLSLEMWLGFGVPSVARVFAKFLEKELKREKVPSTLGKENEIRVASRSVWEKWREFVQKSRRRTP